MILMGVMFLSSLPLGLRQGGLLLPLVMSLTCATCEDAMFLPSLPLGLRLGRLLLLLVFLLVVIALPLRRKLP